MANAAFAHKMRTAVVTKANISAHFSLRRGWCEKEAAIYLSLSPSFFRRLVEQGIMRRPRMAGCRRIWDVEELDGAFRALPREPGANRTDGELDMANSWSDYG